MACKNFELIRKESNLIAKNIDIQEPQNMSTEELLNTLRIYDSKHKVKSNSRKLLKIKLLKYKIFQKMNQVRLKSYKINQ